MSVSLLKLASEHRLDETDPLGLGHLDRHERQNQQRLIPRKLPTLISLHKPIPLSNRRSLHTAEFDLGLLGASAIKLPKEASPSQAGLILWSKRDEAIIVNDNISITVKEITKKDKDTFSVKVQIKTPFSNAGQDFELNQEQKLNISPDGENITTQNLKDPSPDQEVITIKVHELTKNRVTFHFEAADEIAILKEQLKINNDLNLDELSSGIKLGVFEQL